MFKRLLLVSLIFTGALFAQKIEIGAKGGVNIRSLNFKSNYTGFSNETRAGFVGGIFLKYNINEMFSIQPEVLVAVKGGRQDAGKRTVAGVAVPSQRFDYNLTYLDIPVLVNVTFPTQSPISPKLFFGPQVGFLLNAKEKFEENGKQIHDKDIKSNMTKADFSLVFGAGLDVAVTAKAKVLLDLRYDLGLTDLDKGFSKTKTRNRGFMIMGGFSFAL